MNIEYLYEFVELANRLNITDSAKMLHLHQSTLSKHIRSLEQELDASLLYRFGNTISLTDAGYLLAGDATKIIDMYEQTKEEIQRLKHVKHIQIGWAMNDEGLSGLLSTAIILNNSSTNTPVQLKEISKNDLYRFLDEDAISAIVKTESLDFLESHDYEYQFLMSSPFVAIMDKDNPLAVRESLHIEDLRDQTFIKLISPEIGSGWNIIQSVCRSHGFDPLTSPVFRKSLPEQLATPLNDNLFIYASTEREMKIIAKLDRYACIPFADEDAAFPIFIIYKQDSVPMISPFINKLHEARKLF